MRLAGYVKFRGETHWSSVPASLVCAGFSIFRRYSDRLYKIGLSLDSDISCTPLDERSTISFPYPRSIPLLLLSRHNTESVPHPWLVDRRRACSLWTGRRRAHPWLVDRRRACSLWTGRRRVHSDGRSVVGKVVLVIGRSLDLGLESLHAQTTVGTRPVHSTTWRDGRVHVVVPTDSFNVER